MTTTQDDPVPRSAEYGRRRWFGRRRLRRDVVTYAHVLLGGFEHDLDNQIDPDDLRELGHALNRLRVAKGLEPSSFGGLFGPWGPISIKAPTDGIAAVEGRAKLPRNSA